MKSFIAEKGTQLLIVYEVAKRLGDNAEKYTSDFQKQINLLSLIGRENAKVFMDVFFENNEYYETLIRYLRGAPNNEADEELLLDLLIFVIYDERCIKTLNKIRRKLELDCPEAKVDESLCIVM